MPPLHIACAVLATVLWGGNYAAVKVGLAVFPPMLYNGLRFALVGLLLLPYAPVPTRAQCWRIAGIACTLCVGHMGLLFLGIYMGLNIAGGAIILQLGVPFSCLLGALLFGDHIGLWRMTGLLFSAAGTVALMGDPNLLQYPLACLATAGSAFAWSLANVQIKKLQDVNVVTLLAWESLFCVPMFAVLSLLFEHPDWPLALHPSAAVLSAVAYTAVFSTIVAYGLWSWLMRVHDVSRVAPFALLVPFFATLTGLAFFHEQVSLALAEGGALLVMGVAIITLRRPSLQPAAERA